MQAYLQHFLDMAAQNVPMAIFIAFMIAMLEAVFIIGLFVPSTIVLVGIGSLIGLGKLPFWPLYVATTFGAIAGDAISYWVGHHYHERIYNTWPFSRYQNLLEAGKDYFDKHGGKSVVIGRFIPGVKAVVPGIAGMMNMNPIRFTILNVSSAFVWSATHLLPGMSMGLVFMWLDSISHRLLITVLILLISASLLVWVIQYGIKIGWYYLPDWQKGILRWSDERNTPYRRFLQHITSPHYADSRLRILFYALLFLAFLGFILALDQALAPKMTESFDYAFRLSLQGLRTVWTDIPMLVALLSASNIVIISTIIAMALLLVSYRHWQLALGWIASLLSAITFVFVLKNTLQIERPIPDLYTGINTYAFPSGHTTLSALLAGLFIWLTIRACQGRLRLTIIFLIVFWLALISLSCVYLGLHWPSDVLAGLALGLGIMATFSLVFHKEEIVQFQARHALMIGGLLFVCISAYYTTSDWQIANQRYASRPIPPLIMAAPWQAGGWIRLPAYRLDAYGEHKEPFLLQWNGSPEQLATALQGWQAAPEWSISSLNGFAFPATTETELPVLPKLHEGQPADYTWVKAGSTAGRNGRYVLRLYATKVLEHKHSKLSVVWLGTITFERIAHPFGQLSLPFVEDNKACLGTPLLLGLPHAQAQGKQLTGLPRNAGCGGQRVLAYP